MAKVTRFKMAAHYLSLDEEGKKRQHHLAKYVSEFEAENNARGDITDVDYSSMSKKELEAAADGASLDRSRAGTKDELIVLLENKSKGRD